MSQRPHDDARPADNPKQDQLDRYARVPHDGTRMTTDQGVRVEHTDDSLAAGARGPTLIEDFHLREKITRFDHERIPERVVHARGAGAYGYFECYEGLTDVTRAHFLGAAGRHTPVFVRFSTVAGSRGSADTVRDVRGFATKFYTREGNFDLVGNNMPVFFIQDGIKFPDFVHAVKPEPHNEIPQASSAHNTLWDFVAETPETMHMMMWMMSDRALPRSYRMMQGFGVHTFRFVDADGRGTFVKFHWKPRLGVHSLVWDETQKVAGKDPDFNRRDLWEAIDNGDFPEYELGVQLVPESDEFAFDFDLLDPTKIIPEELVPVRPVGKLVLNRNPDNFFAETEQVAFCLGNVVPGIDFTNDPLLQARIFSYLDTQLLRLGGPNFAELPVNRPVTEVHHNQRDGFGQHRIDQGRTSYFPNSLGGGCPALASADEGAFRHYAERVDGRKIRERSESFKDFYSQATLFWNSMCGWERDHIIDAFRFELGKVDAVPVREKVVDHLAHVDHGLAAAVAVGLGLPEPPAYGTNHGRTSPALSMTGQPSPAATRVVAVLAADGVAEEPLRVVADVLRWHGARVELLAPHAGALRTKSGGAIPADRAITTMASVLYDAVLVAGGEESVAVLGANGEAAHYAAEAFKHGKAVGALGSGIRLLEQAPIPGVRLATQAEGSLDDHGVLTLAAPAPSRDELTRFGERLADAVGTRQFNRRLELVPA